MGAQRGNSLSGFFRGVAQQRVISADQLNHLVGAERYDEAVADGQCEELAGLMSELEAGPGPERLAEIVREQQRIREHLARSGLGLFGWFIRRYQLRWDYDEIVASLLETYGRVAVRFDPRVAKFSTYCINSLKRAVAGLAIKASYAKNEGSPRARGGEDLEGAAHLTTFEAVDWRKAERQTYLVELVRKALDGSILLDEMERTVLRRRFLEEETLQVVGDAMGVTRERIRQVETKALAILRSEFDRLLDGGKLAVAGSKKRRKYAKRPPVRESQDWLLRPRGSGIAEGADWLSLLPEIECG